MSSYTQLKDINKNKLYINDIVRFKRNSKTEYGLIIDKSHQFKGVYFIEVYKTKQLVLLNEKYIEKFEVEKRNDV